MADRNDEYVGTEAVLGRLGVDEQRFSAHDYARVMRAVTLIVGGAVAADLPAIGRNALDAARRHWEGSKPDSGALVAHRVECWRYLDEKNGNSTTIADREDVAMRAVICCLHADDEGDVYMTVHFALDMLRALGLAEPEIASLVDVADSSSE